MISFSQNLEDVVLARIFREVEQGFYVDIGANNPNEHTLTRHFYEKGWHGINVEPGQTFKQIVRARPRDITLNLAISDKSGQATFFEFQGDDTGGLATLESEVPASIAQFKESRKSSTVDVKPLAEVFAEHQPPQIDFMSIDVEGHERAVLSGNDWEKYRPRVVIIEAVLPLSTEQTHGQWEDILLKARYRSVLFDGLNRYYLREEDEALSNRFFPACVHDRYVPWSVARYFEDFHAVGVLPEYPDKFPDSFDLRDVTDRMKYVLSIHREYQKMVTDIGPKGLQYGLGITRRLSRLARKSRQLFGKKIEMEKKPDWMK
jgi:FkbM family methyltransferase